MWFRRLSVGVVVGAGLFLAACGADPVADDGRLRVVATTGQIADALRNIGGEHVQVTELLGPGIDPHTYVATEGDVFSLQSAQLIVYNGHQLEAQLERVLRQIGERGETRVLAAAETLPTDQLLQWEPEAGLPYDPHVWNDLTLWREVVVAIGQELSTTDPEHAAAYEANLQGYLGQLDQLHTDLLSLSASIPSDRRVLVTAHDAFSYLGRAYGLEVEAVQGISTEAEASTADIRDLTQLILERNVPALFIETTISPRTIEAVRAAVQAEGRELALGGELYSDALGTPGTSAETYIGMMRHNMNTIVAALNQ